MSNFPGIETMNEINHIWSRKGKTLPVNHWRQNARHWRGVRCHRVGFTVKHNIEAPDGRGWNLPISIVSIATLARLILDTWKTICPRVFPVKMDPNMGFAMNSAETRSAPFHSLVDCHYSTAMFEAYKCLYCIFRHILNITLLALIHIIPPYSISVYPDNFVFLYIPITVPWDFGWSIPKRAL